MKKNIATISFLVTLLALVSCNGSDENVKQEGSALDTTFHEEFPESSLLEKNGIRLTPLSGSPDFPGATLRLPEPEEGSVMNNTSPVFKFEVSNFELGAQTTDESGLGLANSGMGQHIHVIIDNEPYTAHYHDTAKRVLSPGNHLLLAFLSRSYHESLKSSDAFVLRSFITGRNNDASSYDLTAPYLFYSRPKGEYKGSEINNLLLDFYPVNVTIGNDYLVKVVIDGTEFLLNRWQPYTVSGLKPGEHTFRIVLVDKNGQPVPGKFNDSGDRKITLKEA